MVKSHDVPECVLQASRIDWGLLVDAFLFNAAPFEDRFVATVFYDYSGAIRNGETVITPPLRNIERRQGFVLARSTSGRDYYVIVSSYSD